MFLRTMKPQGAGQAGPASRACSTAHRLLAARDLYEFDNVFTAPLHGFRDTDDYWARASAKPHLHTHPHPGAGAQRAQRPVRAGRQPARRQPRSATTSRLWQPAHGGHVGFPAGALAGPRADPAGGGDGLAEQNMPEASGSARGRDRQGSAEEVAQRAALPRLAGAGRARQLVHARRPRAGARARSRAVKGSRIEHDKLLEFIQRNYDHDTDGAWFFQNGPQRVYVELEAAPLVWRVAAENFALTSHNHLPATLRSSLARRRRAPVPRRRPRLRPGAHAGHAPGRTRG